MGMDQGGCKGPAQCCRGWDKPERGQHTLLLAAWPRVSPCLTKVPGAPYPLGFPLPPDKLWGVPREGKTSSSSCHPFTRGCLPWVSLAHLMARGRVCGAHCPMSGQGWGPSPGWHPPGCGLVGHLEDRNVLFFVPTSLREGSVQAAFSGTSLT